MGVLDTLLRPLRQRKREQLLETAANWPLITATLLQSKVVLKDPLVEGGTSVQDSQVESPFFFTLAGREGGSYFGGHVRSTALSDSEAHRLLRSVKEDFAINVRYDPQNPDHNAAFPGDNPGFPFPIWPNPQV